MYLGIRAGEYVLQRQQHGQKQDTASGELEDQCGWNGGGGGGCWWGGPEKKGEGGGFVFWRVAVRELGCLINHSKA